MELADYIRILRKRWWIIAVAVVLTAGSALVPVGSRPSASICSRLKDAAFDNNIVDGTVPTVRLDGDQDPGLLPVPELRADVQSPHCPVRDGLQTEAT